LFLWLTILPVAGGGTKECPVFRLVNMPVSVGLVILSMLFTKVYAAEAPVWTLDAAVRQALSVAPEIREAAAEIAAREGTLNRPVPGRTRRSSCAPTASSGSRTAAAEPT
jgi:hypothetical protein